MPDEPDPFRVLGVSPRATLEEVRAAFHRAVLDCHPDSSGANTEALLDRFGKIVAAYRDLRKRLVPRDAPDKPAPQTDAELFDAADFALMHMGWASLGSPEALASKAPAKLEWQPHVVREEVKVPVVNETLTFVLFWVVALVAGFAAGLLAMSYIEVGDGSEETAVSVSVLVMIAAYVAVFALALVIIVASRRTSWLLRVIGYRKQRALPAPGKGRKLTSRNRWER